MLGTLFIACSAMLILTLIALILGFKAMRSVPRPIPRARLWELAVIACPLIAPAMLFAFLVIA
jgi:hypothetical protein